MAAPTYLPEWAVEDVNLPSTGKANKQRPKESLRNTGWDKGQIPSAEEFNWTLNNYYLWMRYIINEALPTYLPITGTELDFTGNIQGNATWEGDKVTSINLKSDLDTSTPLNNPNTLVKRSVNGDIEVNNFTSYGDTSLEKTKISSVEIVSGIIDKTAIGKNTASTGKFTTIDVTGLSTLSNVDIDYGSIDGTTIGANTPSPTTVSYFTAKNDTLLQGGILSSGNNVWNGSNTFSSQLKLQSSNASQNGYTYLPNGIIMQWGWVASGDDSYIQVNLPTPFPNNCFSVSATPDYNQGVTGQGTLSAHAHIDSRSTIHVGVSSPTSSVPDILGIFWQAIGN